MTGRGGEDRRVRRTKARLHHALSSLLHEKSWDDIVVKEILARADVGRSTFYSHFRDKDELLLSELREMLREGAAGAARPTDPVQRALGFSLPLLEHVERVRAGGGESLGVRGHAALHARLERALVELIAEELRRAVPTPAAGSPAMPLDLVARQVASTFLLTLEWWVGLPEPRPAREADDVFRALARPAVQAFHGR